MSPKRSRAAEGAADLPIALTMGDPAGIGPELTARAWQHLHRGDRAFFWSGDARLLQAVIPVQQIASPAEAREVFPHALPVLQVSCPAPVQPGQPDSHNAPAVISSIEQAVQLTRAGKAGAVVTNPIAKHVLASAGFPHPGHTEFLAALCGVEGQEVMMLASPQLKVVLTSIHVSLRQALEDLNAGQVEKVLKTAHAALKRDFAIAHPRLVLAGLNPHAGENGLMGLEERTILQPVVEKLRAQGLDIQGPLPPDTMFTTRWRSRYDAAICLYHDQGLIPLKTLAMEEGVNVTLGLPIIRTSPDHGTAFDIALGPRAALAGEGKADPGSLLAALEMAASMAANRRVAAASEAPAGKESLV
ncbi:4-hydroxythreonine-4-phosphate dehydrogenase PdxA [Oecophyllibacter saccharovorans]|uniref:4-hydroxythreonine-4-phosphate dehydrogenase PdxA n=1 Tax=Oecophyllibacter saccharovorans TaxID=2558360 RepID=UPI001141B109|nr:4-hydroxythreonine-4-phosphate dehydrogenase PdxA [Oecophyllibacter saccharovorans]QDH15837.1 4-hydroxythreonine-4-phosphate dehydrogenase PdxA [Oecophyllibacter saccharovorans]